MVDFDRSYLYWIANPSAYRRRICLHCKISFLYLEILFKYKHPYLQCQSVEQVSLVLIFSTINIYLAGWWPHYTTLHVWAFLNRSVTFSSMPKKHILQKWKRYFILHHHKSRFWQVLWFILDEKGSSVVFHCFFIMVRVFTIGPKDRGSIPGRDIPKTQKIVLDASLLNPQRYKVRIKGKVVQSGEKSSTLLYTLV